jgi:hypothetical protein
VTGNEKTVEKTSSGYAWVKTRIVERGRTMTVRRIEGEGSE